MNNILLNILRFVILMLAQILVLNHVYLGGYIVPYLYILFILMLPSNTPRLSLLLMAFGSGLLVDVMLNMPGFHAFSATLVAFCRILFADRILTHGEQVVIEVPNFRTVAPDSLMFYLFLLLFIYNFTYFSLVIFSFHDLGRILLSALLSTIVTWILTLLYQLFMFSKKKGN